MEVMSQIVSIHEERNPLPTGAGDAPIIKGVKVLGVESKNGRKYPVEVMQKALEKYDGAMVNIDHPKGDEPRSYEDRFGRLVNPRLEADGIYADLSYNPKHPLAEGFAWWAANDPSAVGLSHNAQARTKLNREGVEEIEEIVEVTSVDLVAEPATTAGLMECVIKAKSIVEAKQPRQMSLSELRNAENKLKSKDSQLNDKIIAKGWGNLSYSELLSKHGSDPDVSAQKKLQDELSEIRYQIDRRGKGYKPEKESMKEEDKVIPKPKVRVEAGKRKEYVIPVTWPKGGHEADYHFERYSWEGTSEQDAVNGLMNYLEKEWKKFEKINAGRPTAGTGRPMSPWPGKNAFRVGKVEVAYEAKEAAPNKKQSIADKKAFIAKAYAKQGVVTMPGIDKNEYPPIPGMEGPFQYRNGKILYYDPREGKYYDRKTDMYVFEEKDMEPELFPVEKENDEGGYEDSLKDQIGDIVMNDELHAEEKVAQLLALLGAGQEEAEEAPVPEAEDMDEEPKEEQDEEDEEEPKKTEESLRRKPSPAVARLLEEVDAYRARDRREKAVTAARQFCSDASLPTYAITESFLGILADVDKKQWKTLVEDRRRVIFRGEKPISSVPADGKLTVDSLVKALRS